MMKFIKHHLSTIEGVEIYPVISLTVFVLFFTAMLIWAFRVPKKHIEQMKQHPLDD